jgi:hypothetical protein
MVKWDDSKKPHIVADAILPRGEVRIIAGYNHDIMADTLTTRLSGELTSQLYKYMLDMIANNCGMDRRTFMEFLQFMAEDPELQRRFTAHKTAKRLRGE